MRGGKENNKRVKEYDRVIEKRGRERRLSMGEIEKCLRMGDRRRR